MDYKKEIIEMIEKIHSESMIKFIYGCVKRAYKEERAGNDSHPCALENKLLKKIT